MISLDAGYRFFQVFLESWTHLRVYSEQVLMIYSEKYTHTIREKVKTVPRFLSSDVLYERKTWFMEDS
jgi:hypothetical protein